jgi:hypothetical protein
MLGSKTLYNLPLHILVVRRGSSSVCAAQFLPPYVCNSLLPSSAAHLRLVILTLVSRTLYSLPVHCLLARLETNAANACQLPLSAIYAHAWSPDSRWRLPSSAEMLLPKHAFFPVASVETIATAPAESERTASPSASVRQSWC